MVEPRSEADADGTGQRHIPAIQGESAEHARDPDRSPPEGGSGASLSLQNATECSTARPLTASVAIL